MEYLVILVVILFIILLLCCFGLYAVFDNLNMTQQDVADATGIQRANIARIESKKHAITLESLIKYANCLNCDICFELQERS